MGTREGFITSTNPKITVEKLGEYLAKNKDFHNEYAPIWIVCQSFVRKDTNVNITNFLGEYINTIHLNKGQEFLCIGFESFTDIFHYFPYHIRKSLVFIEGGDLRELSYREVFEDKPVEVNGKTYFAELIN